MIRVLDTFAGVGGFSLGLERTGYYETIAFCEIDAYCRKVLKRHWPGVPIYDDIRKLTGARLRADGLVPDILTAGFPCQDISVAGRKAGIEGERSGLWSEIDRLVGELRPRIVLLENVPALLSGDRGRWFGRVLGDLAALGYDAEWHCIPASYIGAPHRRDRVWIIAYSDGPALRVDEQRQQQRSSFFGQPEPQHDGPPIPLAGGVPDANGEGLQGPGSGELRTPRGPGQPREDLADAEGQPLGAGLREAGPAGERRGRPGDSGCPVPDTFGERLEGLIEAWATAGTIDGSGNGSDPGWWTVEPDIRRVAHGIPSRVDRLRSLGNAIVPQLAELIGHAIVQGERR